MPQWQLTQPNKNSRFCVSSRNLIFPGLRISTTQRNKLVRTDLKLCFFLKYPPPRHPPRQPTELFQFSVTHKENLQDSQEIGSPLPPLLLDADGMVGAGAVEWEQTSEALGDMPEGRHWEGPLRSLRDFEMVSFSLFIS